MSFFVQPTVAPVPRTSASKQIAVVYAGFLVLMAVGQLFSFEKFIPLVESFWLPGGMPVAYLFAAGIVVAEVFAVPFLLRMSLSPAMRVVSIVLGWVVPAVWLFVTVWLLMTVNAVANVGIFGASVPLAPEWWVVWYVLALSVLAAWASWGLWPFGRTTKKRTTHRKA